MLHTIFCIILYCSFLPYPQTTTQQTADLIADMTRHFQDHNCTGTAIWYPPEFLLTVLQQKTPLAPEDQKKARQLFARYPLFALLFRKHPHGQIEYVSPHDLRPGVFLSDSSGKKRLPLANTQVPAELRTLTAALRPLLNQTLGETGKNIEFIYFAPSEDSMPKEIYGNSKDTLNLFCENIPDFPSNFSLQWHLPLPSLLPTKICSQCQVVCRGDWIFCPWDGTRL